MQQLKRLKWRMAQMKLAGSAASLKATPTRKGGRFTKKATQKAGKKVDSMKTVAAQRPSKARKAGVKRQENLPEPSNKRKQSAMVCCRLSYVSNFCYMGAVLEALLHLTVVDPPFGDGQRRGARSAPTIEHIGASERSHEGVGEVCISAQKH